MLTKNALATYKYISQQIALNSQDVTHAHLKEHNASVSCKSLSAAEYFESLQLADVESKRIGYTVIFTFKTASWLDSL